MERQSCTMPTGSLRICSRAARYLYCVERDGTSSRPDVSVAAYCAQHDRAEGHSRMLRVRSWEYDYRLDVMAGIRTWNVGRRA